MTIGLRLEVSGALISFYRLDNGEKLLIPLELRDKAQHLQVRLTLEQARLLSEQARSLELENQLNQAQAEINRYRRQFGDLP